MSSDVMAAPQPQPQEAPDPARQHLQVAPKPHRKLIPRVGWTVVILAVAVLSALALFHAVIVDRQGVLDGLNDSLEEVRVENEKLRLAVAEAEAPDRIVAEALYRLGMVEPKSRFYLSPVELDESGMG